MSPFSQNTNPPPLNLSVVDCLKNALFVVLTMLFLPLGLAIAVIYAAVVSIVFVCVCSMAVVSFTFDL